MQVHPSHWKIVGSGTLLWHILRKSHYKSGFWVESIVTDEMLSKEHISFCAILKVLLLIM